MRASWIALHRLKPTWAHLGPSLGQLGHVSGHADLGVNVGIFCTCPGLGLLKHLLDHIPIAILLIFV
jgi:hypothetical protein